MIRTTLDDLEYQSLQDKLAELQTLEMIDGALRFDEISEVKRNIKARFYLLKSKK